MTRKGREFERPAQAGDPGAAAGRIRLQKLLSDAGVASRRRCEELIRDGFVLVNDEVLTQLPVFVDPRRDRVEVQGNLIRPRAPEYFMVHKPKGVVCTNRDPAGRPRANDLLPPNREHLFPVGRLDADSSGMLLMTNDGELAQRIMHPSFGVTKVYRVEVQGDVTADLPTKLRRGVHLSEGRAAAADVELVHRARDRSILRITLREARHRQVRRVLARLGYKVRELKRIQIGPLDLRGLPIGACRPLRRDELRALREAAASAATRPRRAPGKFAATRPQRAPLLPRETGAREPSGAPARPQRAGRRPAQPGRAPDAGAKPRRRLIT